MLRLAVVLAVVLAFPAAAVAQAPETNAPPGNSAIDEYLETVPNASGDYPPRSRDRAPEDPALTPQQRVAIERSSPDGAQLAELIEQTAPPTARAGGRTVPPPVTPETPTTAPELVTRAEGHSRAPIETTLAAAIVPNDGGGLGVLFPLILAASLFGVIALAVLRRR